MNKKLDIQHQYLVFYLSHLKKTKCNFPIKREYNLIIPDLIIGEKAD